jgi:dTMP kinase
LKDYNLYIAVDGIDGCGKTTLTDGMAKNLTSNGREVLLTREPGGTATGKIFREMLISSEYDLEPETELMLYCADRLEHQTKKVIPALNAGKNVISDRFMSSTYAYQIFGRNLNKTLLDTLSGYSVKRMPDITFIIEIDPKTAIDRAMARLERENKVKSEGKFESLGLEFYERVSEGFQWYAGKFENVWRINGEQSPEDVLKDVTAIMDNFV